MLDLRIEYSFEYGRGVGQGEKTIVFYIITQFLWRVGGGLVVLFGFPK